MVTRDQLELFVYRADELRHTRLVRTSSLRGDFSFHFNQKTAAYKFPVVDEDDLRSFLLTFRQFVMKQEPVFIRNIYALAHQHITAERLRAAVDEAARSWRDTLKSCGFALEIRGRRVTPEHALDLFINGHYFHNDEEKRAELLKYGIPDVFLVRNQFLNFLVDATMNIAYTSNVIRAALQDGTVG